MAQEKTHQGNIPGHPAQHTWKCHSLPQLCCECRAALTWDENGHGLLLAQDGVEDGAGHVPHRAVSHHQSGLHTEQLFSILPIGLRECQELPSTEASPLHLGLWEPPRGSAHHSNSIFFWPLDVHFRSRAHPCGREAMGGTWKPPWAQGPQKCLHAAQLQ